MKATPLVPGHLYHVTGRGVDRLINADHPCSAIKIVINELFSL